MSERILKALMQLFAIIAKVDMEEVEGGFEISGGGRDIVRLFLRQELNQELVNEYIHLFDEFKPVLNSNTDKESIVDFLLSILLSVSEFNNLIS